MLSAIAVDKLFKFQHARQCHEQSLLSNGKNLRRYFPLQAWIKTYNLTEEMIGNFSTANDEEENQTTPLGNEVKQHEITKYRVYVTQNGETIAQPISPLWKITF